MYWPALFVLYVLCIPIYIGLTLYDSCLHTCDYSMAGYVQHNICAVCTVKGLCYPSQALRNKPNRDAHKMDSKGFGTNWTQSVAF